MTMNKLQHVIKGCPFCGNPILVNSILETVTGVEVDLYCRHCNYTMHFNEPYLFTESTTYGPEGLEKKKLISLCRSFEEVWNSRTYSISEKESEEIFNADKK